LPEKELMTAAGPQSKRRSGVIVPHAPTWKQKLAGWLVVILVRVLALTLRYRFEDRAGILNGTLKGPQVFCLWHNRLAFAVPIYRRFICPRSPRVGMAAMVSASKDGGFLAGIFEIMDVEAVRGSSSRRGAQALLELAKLAQRGFDLTITPDGPRGPIYRVQDGIIALAQVTGLPVIPCSYYFHSKVRLKSWDRLQIPLPFSRCEAILEKPVSIPREMSAAEREALRSQIEKTLLEISRD
jgi:hypothetical protein